MKSHNPFRNIKVVEEVVTNYKSGESVKRELLMIKDETGTYYSERETLDNDGPDYYELNNRKEAADLLRRIRKTKARISAN